ncbi:YhjD/YihY/BrkB family envelope integrity protein [uncultured Friedmanniella sp.]|uniref:YhjD/YihY/BrkB family envelope integrity protein n=1 Tax=uncultured Friedmanniella sp. TaxID=335381 RepID=UPI0035C94E1E
MAEPTQDDPPEKPELKPGFPHLLRAVERYFARLGTEFAAAITYFSVLAVIPILLFLFTLAGLLLTVLRPELLQPVANAAADAIGSADPAVRKEILDKIGAALGSWRATSVATLLTALYSGIGWMGNLKNAVRAQWRPQFDLQGPGGNIVAATLKLYAVNLLQLALLVLAMVVTFALASFSTTLADAVLTALGLGRIGLLHGLLRVVPVLFSVGAGYVLFLYLYTVLPETRAPRRAVHRGALVGAIGLVVLQYLSTFLIGKFSSNPAFAIFGSVIALMLFFNLFARLILFLAAWIATAEHPAVPAPPTPVVVTELAPPPDAERQAEQVVRWRTRFGFVTGAAMGLGVGATLVWRSLVRRRDP